MITAQFEIIRAFSKEFRREFTINQISKSIRKSYAFTNKYTHELIDSKILEKKEVGSAIVCLLNLENNETQSMLTYNSLIERKEYLESISGQKRAAIESLISAWEGKAHTIFLEKNTLVIVSDEKKELQKTAGQSTKQITKPDFERQIRHLNFSEIKILLNNETFWRMISKAVQA